MGAPWRRSAVNSSVVAYAGTMLLMLGGGEMVARPTSRSTVVDVTGCYAIDGDTLRCGRTRVRLLGIDAAEKPGHCRQGRVCAPGDPFTQRAALQRLAGGRLTIDPVKQDKFGRLVAVVHASSGGNLSCQMLQAGASYVARWDDGKRIWRSCTRIARTANQL